MESKRIKVSAYIKAREFLRRGVPFEEDSRLFAIASSRLVDDVKYISHGKAWE